MPPKPLKKDNELRDAAQGSIAGFIFQFQYALVLLSDLTTSGQSISIEKVDDVGVHNSDGTVILTVQAKHSIAVNGATFRDTGRSLWRTIEIWIKKLKTGVFSKETKFRCTTNKGISTTSLLYKMTTQSFDNVITEIARLMKTQEDKLAKAEASGKSGLSLSEGIGLMKFALENKDELKLIVSNLQLDSPVDAKNAFLNKIYTNTKYVSDEGRDQIYQSFYGWILDRSNALWLHFKDAIFTKEQFDDKHHLIVHAHSIVNAIFRTKQNLGSITENEIVGKHGNIFVKQLEDMNWREDVKERRIKEAILDFICHDIELEHVVENGDFTKTDFEQFLTNCTKAWQKVFDRHFSYELHKYNEDERNKIADSVYNDVMDGLKVEFSGGFCFSTENEYVRNGAFYKLSDVPSIGWHPEWEDKYRK
ncbi:hypothetical protein SAMN05518672_10934 [Chitinophaga sp. CF118]|uniref:ABC-three component system protein n=1 Tax=Chitinophaga sp. CF118 TaxID=1884367 RepID=UPI0008E00A1D|nr:ABC-three component system protein [Chitinophaga sp. CF118]SFE67438.1 hypothetical protein SAMN05518672_10934 [Chitinophaga sp. CF118]